jgi:predicted negative regulator of RcsB-dependent stress response
MRRLRWIALLTIVAGCAYYNGLYNANQLAKEAHKAESKGRTGEAQSYWAQAAVKAETVAARYPKSKYRDDALLLQGTALAHTNLCIEAIAPLRLAEDSSPDPSIQRKARLQLGECFLTLGSPDSARRVLTPLVTAKNAASRNAALLVRGRAFLALGAPAAALEDLSRTDDRAAAFPRARALLALGRDSAAVAVLTARAPGPYDETAWSAILDTLGAADPAAASRVARVLAARTDLSDGARARLELADGRRWLAAGDVLRAADAFRAAASQAADSIEGHDADGYLVVLRLRALRSPDSVHVLSRDLQHVRAGVSIDVDTIVSPAATAVARLDHDMTDTSADATLDYFRTTEVLRDSLAAPHLAEGLFLWLAQHRPRSLLAPKALLAAAALRPAIAESVGTALEAEYPRSVYTLALHGEGAARYRVVEDSLAQALARRAGGPPGAAAAAGRPGNTARDTLHLR